MDTTKEEINQRYKEQDFLFYFRYRTVGCCSNEVEEVLMLYAIRDKIIAYNGRETHLPTVSQWQYDKIVKRLTKCVKSWESLDNEHTPLEVIMNFDGVPRRYYGDCAFKNFRKFHKIVDCIRKGLTIL